MAKQSTSCLGCFGVALIALVVIAVLGVWAISVRDNRIDSTFELIVADTDKFGDYMQVFASTEQFTDSDLRQLVSRRATGKGERFEYITVFDDKQFAELPLHPFGGGYDLQKQVEQQKHIVATWVHGTNGFDELRRYSPDFYTGSSYAIETE